MRPPGFIIGRAAGPVPQGARRDLLPDHLEAGESVDDCLEGFPSVMRGQVVLFLECAKDRLIEAAS